MEIVWEDPPSPPAGRDKFDDFREALKDRPGRWARYPGARPRSRGWKAAWPGFEFVSRENGKIVYCRYVGGPAPEPPRPAPSLTSRNPRANGPLHPVRLPSLADEMDRGGVVR